MAKLQALQEDWRSGSNVSILWSGYFGVTSVVSSQLNFTVASGATNFHGFNSASSYNLTDSYLFQEVVNAGNQALVSLELYIAQMQLDGNNKVAWYLNQNVLKCYKTVATTRTQVGSNLAYDSTVHKFFRIRELNGTAYWDYSTDGIGWTNQTSALVSSLFAITALTLALSVGTTGTEGSGTTVIYDSINIVSTNKPGNSFRNTQVGSGMSRSEGAT